MAAHDLVEIIHVGYRDSLYVESQRLATDGHPIVVAPANGSAVAGVVALTGDYQTVWLSWQDTGGNVKPLTIPIPYFEIAVPDEGFDPSVETLAASPIGPGINVSVQAVTRYYSFGWVADALNLGIDDAYQPIGRVMQFVYQQAPPGAETSDWRGVVTLSNDTVVPLKQVKWTIDANAFTAPTNVPGVATWKLAMYVFTTLPKNVLELNAQGGAYIGEVDPVAGGVIIDSGQSANTFYPEMYINASESRTVFSFGNQFVWAGGSDRWQSQLLKASDGSYPQVMTPLDDDDDPILYELWVRKNGSTTDPAIDPIDEGEDYEWPQAVIGKRIYIAGRDDVCIIEGILPSTDTSDSGEYTILRLAAPLVSAISTPVDFRISGQSMVKIGHPDVRMSEKVPASLQLDATGFINNPITGGMADAEQLYFIVCSNNEMAKVINAPTAFAATGNLEGVTPPYFLSVSTDVGCVSQQALIRGASKYIMGFSDGRGPWIFDGSSPRLLDEARNLAQFYDGLTEGQKANASGAFSSRLNLAMWCFPNINGDLSAQMHFNAWGQGKILVFDFNTSTLSWFEMIGYSVQALTTIQQYEKLDDYDHVGDTIIGALQDGSIVEFNELLFGDLSTDPENNKVMGGTVTEKADTDTVLTILFQHRINEIAVFFGQMSEWIENAMVVIIGRDPSYPRDSTFSARLGASVPLTQVVQPGNIIKLASTWNEVQVGDIVCIAPIRMLFTGSDLRSIKTYSAIQSVDNVAADLPIVTPQDEPPAEENGTLWLDWRFRVTVLSGGNTTTPQSNSKSVATVLRGASLQQQSSFALRPNVAGKSVRVQIDSFVPPDKGLTIDQVDFTARG